MPYYPTHRQVGGNIGVWSTNRLNGIKAAKQKMVMATIICERLFIDRKSHVPLL